MKTATLKEIPINWFSKTDLLSDYVDVCLERQSNWFVVSISIQNPKNTRRLEDLKKDKEAMQLLAALQKLPAMEIEVYEDDRHELFNIEVYLDNQKRVKTVRAPIAAVAMLRPIGTKCG
jgi:hypothetical protein